MKLSTLETCVRIESRAHTPIRKVLAFALALGPTALIGCATPPREPVRAPVAEVAKPIATEAMASRRVEPAGAPVALPAEVRDMALSFVAADGDPAAAQISRTMRAALVREGYWLAEPGSRTPDGRLEVHVSRAPSADADAEGSELKVDLVLVRDQSTVESLVTSIDPSVPASMPKRIDELVQRLSGSPRLAAFAREASISKAERRIVPPRRVATDEPRPETALDQASREEAAWSDAALRRCRNARGVDACKKVREYVEMFPDGAHASSAKAALELSAHRSGQPVVSVAKQ